MVKLDIKDIKSIEDIKYYCNQFEEFTVNNMVINKSNIQDILTGIELSKIITSNKIKKGIGDKKIDKTLHKYQKAIELIKGGLSVNKSLIKVGISKSSFYNLDKQHQLKDKVIQENKSSKDININDINIDLEI